MESYKWANDWLPVTASRKAKWWYSAFHNVNAILGVGVLGLPFAMSELGWGPGIAVLIVMWMWTLYTLWQLVLMHESVPRKRFDRYHELGQHAFGETLGLWIVVPQQLVHLVTTNIAYMVYGGMSLKRFHDIVTGDTSMITPLFILIFASVHFVISQVRSLNSLSAVSLAAAVMSVSYSIIAWGASLRQGKAEDVDYGYRPHTATGTVFGFFSALGNVAFAYAGHGVVVEIQATIPSTPGNQSKGPMLKGVITTYIIIALCYFPVALVGYWAFGNKVEEDIFDTLRKVYVNTTWVVALINMMLVIHVIGSYQIYAMPVFDMMESFLTKTLDFSPGVTLSLITRSIYVAFTMFAAISFSDFRSLLGFVGGFAGAPINYFLPCIMWLTIYKPRRFSVSWFANWICIIFGVILMAISAIGGLRKIILSD